MRRRDFLKRAGCFVASAAVPAWVGCGDDDTEKPSPHDAGADGGSSGATYEFLQGVASGDPQPTSVMLWTRVTAKKSSKNPISMKLEVSKTKDFEKLEIDKDIEATIASDFTVRVLTTDLEPGTTYYYRFSAGMDESRVGRTRTAPDKDTELDVKFAWVSCQDYASNFYSSYRQLLNDDEKRPESEQIHFVMHLGDFIYETRDAGFMTARNDDLEPIALKSKSGKPRVVPEFPSGGGMASTGATFAKTVEDYRHLYKTFLSDPDLQEARARWPFINTWDDHEFTDDAWQSQANYDRKASLDEPSQTRRVAASQAWFEYVPAVLGDLGAGDVANDARDFKSVAVEDAPYTDVIVVDEPNNQKAIHATTIYRNLRWGKHVDLVLTDNRSYRSDHALAEDSSANDILVFHPRAALPKDPVNILDAGKTANNGNPPDMAGRFPNTRKDSEPGTMLGAAQKAWWKSTMKASNATWRIWGNPVPLLRIQMDGSAVALISDQLLLSPDAWDGYNTERKELMAHLRDNQIYNVVSLSGDHHAHYAGVVYDDYDASTKKPIMVDIVAAGISSASQFEEIAGAFDTSIPEALKAVAADVRKVIVYDSTPLGGSSKAVVNMNTLLRYGSKAANEAAASNDLDKIEAARDLTVNPHLRYADSAATGYGLASVSAGQIGIELVTISRKFTDIGTTSPGIKCKASFTIKHVSSFDDVDIPDPALEGTKPFPLK
jgi:alkaline phosphatase D